MTTNMPPDLQISHDKQGTSYDDDLGQQWIDNTHLEASDVIVTLGLDASDLEASVYDMLSTSKRRKAAVSLKGEAARHFLDILQNIIDETQHPLVLIECRKCIRKLSERSGILPTSFFVHDIERIGDHPVSGGGFADIYQGLYRNQTVALKVLRVFTTDNMREKLQHEFCREALSWRQLKHPNVMPFIGVSNNLFPPHMCMVSFWMKNGNIMQYLEKHADHDRIRLLHGVSEGIKYLHFMDPPIIHGDIRGANVLVDECLNPILSDFGLAIMSDTNTATYGTGSLIKGSIGWMAPEFFAPNLFEGADGKRSTQTDIYAFACLGYEIYTHTPPFHGGGDAAVMFRVLQEQRPKLPNTGYPISPEIWKLITMCWTHQPNRRPQIDQVVQILDRILYPSDPDSATHATFASPPESDVPLPTFWQRSLAEHQALLGIPGPLAQEHGVINGIAFNQAGRLVGSGCVDGWVNIWDAEKGDSWRFKVPLVQVTSVGFSPAGKRIVSGSDDGSVRIWDTDTGACRQLPGNPGGHMVAFAPDGKCIILGSSTGLVRIWDVDLDVAQTFSGHNGAVTCVAGSQDGKQLASGSEQTVRVWDVKSSECQTFAGHTGQVNSVAWSPDGKYLVSGAGDTTARVWAINSPSQSSQILEGHTASVRCVAFSPNGKYIASGSADKTICVWDPNTGGVVSGPLEGSGDVLSLTFSRDSRFIFSVYSNGEARAWKV